MTDCNVADNIRGSAINAHPLTTYMLYTMMPTKADETCKNDVTAEMVNSAPFITLSHVSSYITAPAYSGFGFF